MSRRYTSTSEDFNEPKIYVNNMNTESATMQIPDRPAKKRTDNNNNNNTHNMNDRTNVPAAPVNTQTSNFSTYNSNTNNNNTNKGIVLKGTTSTVNNNNMSMNNKNEDNLLHPNLENTYKSIMRRLQRKLNYEEANKVPLSKQFGIEADGSTANNNNNNNEEEDVGASNTVITKVDPQKVEVTPLGNVITTALPPTNSTVHYKPAQEQARLNVNHNNTLSANTTVGGGGGLSDEEAVLAGQPCPPTLRLILQHVLDTVQRKLTIAERGSISDCVQLTFESKSLLDRLLKEMPSYCQFTEEEGAAMGEMGTFVGGGSRYLLSSSSANLPASSAHANLVQSIVSSTRKNNPTLLPASHYDTDKGTGRVQAVLDLTEQERVQLNPNPGIFSGNTSYNGNTTINNNNNNSLNSKVQFVDHVTEFRSRHSNANMSGTNSMLGDELSRHGEQTRDMPKVQLPETYAKSARIYGKEVGTNANNNNTAQIGKSRSPLPLQQQRASHGGSAEEKSITNTSNAGNNNNVNASKPSSHYDEESNPEDLATATGPRQSMMSNSSNSRRPTASVDECRSRASATQCVSVGTITEDNNDTNRVNLEDYVALQRHCDELKIQLEESKKHREALSDRLLEEGNYTETKSRIIEYLRSTLLKECNTLRTQLSFAAKKEHFLNTTIQQQQKQLASGGGNGGGGSGGASGNTSVMNLGHSLRNANTSVANMHNKSLMLGRSMATSASRANVMASRSNFNAINTSGNNNNNMRVDKSFTRSVAHLDKSSEMLSNANVQSVLGSAQPGDLSHSSGNNNNGNNAGDVQSYGRQLLDYDITSIQSLLDFALLAIETDQEFAVSPEELRNVNYEDADQVMQSNAKLQLEKARMEFEDKQRNLKYNYLNAQMRHTAEMKEKESEINRLKELSDIPHVREKLKESVKDFRSELRKLKNNINEEFRVFRIALNGTGATLVNRAGVMDKTLQENSSLLTTQEALFDIVASAASLFIPMLTREYQSGYHPWPLRLRNSVDPFSHLVQVRYGPAEVLRLRESLTILSDLYVAVHQFVSKQVVVPEMSRMATGRTLEELCWRFVLHPGCNTETYYEIRQHYGEELRLCKAIARLHYQLMWNVYMQNVYTERSVNALISAGIDANNSTLPVSRLINQLGARREVLNRQLMQYKKERNDNAREVYKLWAEKGVDLYQGRPAPTIGKQLNLLSEAQTSGRVGAAGLQRPLQQAKAFSHRRRSLAAEEVALEQQWKLHSQQEQMEKNKNRRTRLSHVEEMVGCFRDEEEDA